MARIDWVESRLLNWARWTLQRGSGAMGYASVNMGQFADGNTGRSGYVEATIPVLGIEASETDTAVKRLPGELLAAVRTHYVSNVVQAEKLRDLCCSVRTLQLRIERAHRLLADHFLAQQDRQRIERARVEGLQRTRRA